MSSESGADEDTEGPNPPITSEEMDEEVKEYIDILHDRIQFLTEELEEAERTILELRQGEAPDGKIVTDEDTDLGRIATYMTYLERDFDTDEDEVKELVEDLCDYFNDYVDSTDDVHTASLALMYLFLEHEEMVS